MRWVFYFVLLINNQFLFGMLGAYSVTKKGISEQFSFTQNVFGLGEMFSMASRVIITTYLLLIPQKNLKETHFIYSIIQSFGYWFLVLAHFLPSLALPIFYLGMTIFGIGRGIYSFPYLILIRTFNQASDKSCVNIWIALSMGGNLFGFYLQTWMLDTLKLHWTLALSIFSFIYFVLSLITYIVVDEAEIQIDSTGACEKMTEMIQTMKIFYRRQTSNILQLIDFCFLENHMFVLLFWLPYYFNKLGYGYSSTTIAIAYPIFIVIGSFVFNPVFDRFPKQVYLISIILVLFTFLGFAAMLFFGSDQADFPIYIVLLGFACFNYIVPFTRSFASQISDRSQNPKEKYLILNFMRIVREVLTGLTVLLIGALTEINMRNFLYIFVANIGLALIFHVPRRLIEKQQNQNRQQLQLQRSDSSM